MFAGNGGRIRLAVGDRAVRRALVMVGMARNACLRLTRRKRLSADGHIDQRILRFRWRYISYRFKALGLGKLIGKRTWGGVIGIRESLPLADGGQFFKPEFAPYSNDGKQ